MFTDTAWYNMIQLQIGVVAAKVIFISFFHVALGSLTPKSICSIPKLALKLLWSCHQYLEKDPVKKSPKTLWVSPSPPLLFMKSIYKTITGHVNPSIGNPDVWIAARHSHNLQTFSPWKLDHGAAQVMGQHLCWDMQDLTPQIHQLKKTLKLETELKPILRRKFLPWTHLVHDKKP